MCFSLIWLRAQIGPLGTFGNLVVNAIRIVIWVIVACLCVYFIFDLVSCLLGSGGLSLPAVPRR